jgi:hypothetical protein
MSVSGVEVKEECERSFQGQAAANGNCDQTKEQATAEEAEGKYQQAGAGTGLCTIFAAVDGWRFPHST